MPSAKKWNLGLFFVLAVGSISLLLCPDVLTAAVFVAVTAVYTLAVRFLHETNPD